MKKQINISKTDSCTYSMEEVSKIVGFKNRSMLFRFLRRYSIIKQNKPASEFLITGYFTVLDYGIRSKEGKVFKYTPVIRVTGKGIHFINDLKNTITKDFYVQS